MQLLLSACLLAINLRCALCLHTKAGTKSSNIWSQWFPPPAPSRYYQQPPLQLQQLHAEPPQTYAGVYAPAYALDVNDRVSMMAEPMPRYEYAVRQTMPQPAYGFRQGMDAGYIAAPVEPSMGYVPQMPPRLIVPPPSLAQMQYGRTRQKEPASPAWDPEQPEHGMASRSASIALVAEGGSDSHKVKKADVEKVETMMKKADADMMKVEVDTVKKYEQVEKKEKAETKEEEKVDLEVGVATLLDVVSSLTSSRFNDSSNETANFVTEFAAAPVELLGGLERVQTALKRSNTTQEEARDRVSSLRNVTLHLMNAAEALEEKFAAYAQLYKGLDSAMLSLQQSVDS